MKALVNIVLILSATITSARSVSAQEPWEITPASQEAVERGLKWLARTQGPAGNWESNDLGLVSLGALAFLSAGHAPDRGEYGDNLRRALDYVISHAQPSGLINIANERRDMYNHGLSVFVLTQAYGRTDHPKLEQTLRRGIKLICDVQCDDGGWDYVAKRRAKGHDLSLAVMQAKALRGAMDIGLEVPPQTVQRAIASVRAHYRVYGKPDGKRYTDHPLAATPGFFSYDGRALASHSMAAAGALCLQEYGLYDDFRIRRSIDWTCILVKAQWKVKPAHVPFDAYATYYITQALYQFGGSPWRDYYPFFRKALVHEQVRAGDSDLIGSWEGGRGVSGLPGRLFGTSVAVFALSIPNRYLPSLQRAEMDSESDNSP